MINQTQGEIPKEVPMSGQDTVNIILAEYNNLRAEIGNRVGLEYQIISLTLVALGAVIALGIKPENINFTLLYPVLIMFLSAIWQDNQLRIEDISTHIKTKIAPRLKKENISWELSQKPIYYTGSRGALHNLLSVIGKRGAFIGNGFVIWLIGLSLVQFDITKLSAVNITSFWIGMVSIIITIVILILPSFPFISNSTWSQKSYSNPQANTEYQESQSMPIEHLGTLE